MFRFIFLPLEMEKTKLHLWKICEIVWMETPHLAWLEIPRPQKPRLTEIPHTFFLNIPGDSTCFLIDSARNFHMRSFFKTPG